MKKLYTLLTFSIFIIVSASCTFTSTEEGPIGPRGPQGDPGPEAFVFEFEDITFTGGNDYTQFLEYPSDFQPFNTDHVLVYFLWDYIADTETDVWRVLPQTLFTDFGTLLYNYDHTPTDVKLFMEANFNLDVLPASFTDSWTVRVVVVPGDFGKSEKPEVDFTNYHEVIDYYNLNENGSFSKQRRP